jgi:molybdopterin molybdotransferase
MKAKHDSQLRPFDEIYTLTLERAAWRASSALHTAETAAAAGAATSTVAARTTTTAAGAAAATETAAAAGAAAVAEAVPLTEAPRRVLASDALADRDLPPYNRVAVDGYACRREDLNAPVRLSGTVAAGDREGCEVTHGCCVKVMTGGVLPEGAECVVMVEDTESFQESGSTFVRFTGNTGRRVPGNYSERGEDVKKGDLIIPRGTILGTRHLALLASIGMAEVPVAALPRVAVISTGNEVVEPDVFPEAHQIRNANGAQTLAQLKELGIEGNYYGIIPDDSWALTAALKKAAEENDLILMSGGVSMGDFDLAPGAMEEVGFSILYDRVAVKPGRPTTFAVSDQADLFGLPGNPVSCFVIMEILIKPYLYTLMHAEPPVPCLTGTLAGRLERRNSERDEWIPVSVDPEGFVRPVAYHGSGHFQALVQAGGLIKFSRGEKNLEKGSAVAVRSL